MCEISLKTIAALSLLLFFIDINADKAHLLKRMDEPVTMNRKPGQERQVYDGISDRSPERNRMDTIKPAAKIQERKRLKTKLHQDSVTTLQPEEKKSSLQTSECKTFTPSAGSEAIIESTG